MDLEGLLLGDASLAVDDISYKARAPEAEAIVEFRNQTMAANSLNTKVV